MSAEGVGQPRQRGRRRILLGSVPLRRRPIPGTDLGGKGVGIDKGDSLRKVGGHRQIRRSDDSPPSLGQCILQASPGAGWGRIETDLHEMARIALQQDGPQFAEPGDELPRIALASRRRQAEIAVIQQNHRQIGSELVEARLRVQNLLPVITVDAFVDVEFQAAAKTGRAQDGGEQRGGGTGEDCEFRRAARLPLAGRDDAIQEFLALDEKVVGREQLQGQPQIGDRLGEAILAGQEPRAV